MRWIAIAAAMLVLVTGVSLLVQVYSLAYLHEESAPALGRYYAYQSLFAFSMLLLVMGSNFVVMFFGWEGVGLCSYGLIAFWYTDIEKAKAGMKAFVVNRFGDFGFIIGLFIQRYIVRGLSLTRAEPIAGMTIFGSNSADTGLLLRSASSNIGPRTVGLSSPKT